MSFSKVSLSNADKYIKKIYEFNYYLGYLFFKIVYFFVSILLKHTKITLNMWLENTKLMSFTELPFCGKKEMFDSDSLQDLIFPFFQLSILLRK